MSQNIKPKTQLPEKKTTLAGEIVTVFPFSLDQRGSGAVQQENSLKDSAGNTMQRYHEKANINVGHLIQGKKLYGFGRKPLGKITVGGEGRTGGHTGQSVTVHDCCFLKVWDAYNGTVDLEHPRKLFAPLPPANLITIERPTSG